MIDPNLPVTSRKQLEFDGFRVFRSMIRAGAFPTNRGGELRIIATLGAGWQLDVIQGATHHYSNGEICLLPPSLQRRATFRTHGDNLFISVETSLLKRLAAEAGDAVAAEHLQLQTLSDPFVYQITNALAREINLDAPRGRIYTESLVLALLGYLVRARPTTYANVATEGGLSPRNLRLCEHFIDAHLGEELALENIAEAVNMSAFHFARAFKKSTGQTPHRYVMARRVAIAREIVEHTDRPLSEISAELGFCSASHFSTVFRSVTGRTPSAFRRR
jgi:AraC family transcriptional regulator